MRVVFPIHFRAVTVLIDTATSPCHGRCPVSGHRPNVDENGLDHLALGQAVDEAERVPEVYDVQK